MTRTDNRSAIESKPGLNLNFMYYDLPRWMQFCRTRFSGKLLCYVLWQWCAAGYVRKLFPALPFDAVQHVTYVSVRYPSFMGSLGIPFYFGPVSGGERIPARLRKGFSFQERWCERLRDLSNCLVPLDPLLRWVFRRADKIIVTHDTVPLIPRRLRHKCDVRLAVGLTTEYLNHAATASQHDDRCFRLLYVGRLLEWKGIDVALRAIRQLKQWQLDVRFTIVGDGPARSRFVKLARKLELSEIVDWVNYIPRSAVEDHYRNADLFLFPSLRDSGGTAVLEALAHGLPVVCTELGGPGVMVNERCGRVVPAVDRTQEEFAIGFADAVREIMTTSGLHHHLSAGAKARAREFDFQNLVRSVYRVSPRSEAIHKHECTLQLSALVPRDISS